MPNSAFLPNTRAKNLGIFKFTCIRNQTYADGRVYQRVSVQDTSVLCFYCSILTRRKVE